MAEPAPIEITAVDVFTDPVLSPANGATADQAMFLQILQILSNRTLYLKNRIGGALTLPASTVLGRMAAGVTGAQPTTDYAFSLLALASARLWVDKINTKAAAVASANTTDIAAATGNYVEITGAADIHHLGNADPGAARLLLFNGGAKLVYNATNLVLPGGNDITTEDGDTAIAVSEGGGNWRVLVYQRAVPEGGGTAEYRVAYSAVITVDLTLYRDVTITSLVTGALEIRLENGEDGFEGNIVLENNAAAAVFDVNDGVDERIVVSDTTALSATGHEQNWFKYRFVTDPTGTGKILVANLLRAVTE